MPFSYPLDPPVSPIPAASVEYQATDIVGANVSPFTGQGEFLDWQAGFMTLNITLPPMTYEQAQAWKSFFLQLKGRFGTFRMGDPAYKMLGAGGGTPAVNSFPYEGNFVGVENAAHSVTGWLKTGDYIQIGDFLYNVVADVNTTSGGGATIWFWPQLRNPPPIHTPIVIDSPKGLWRLPSNQRTWSVGPALIHEGLAFSAVEAI